MKSFTVLEALSLTVLATLIAGSPALVPTHHLSKRIPAAAYEAGNYALYAQNTPIVALDNGVLDYFQAADGNFVVYVNGTPKWYSGVNAPCGPPNHCTINFQSDGNLVTYINNSPTWASWTQGQGKWLVFFSIQPYIVIYNAAYQPIWATPITPRQAPVPQQAKKGGGGIGGFISFVVPFAFATF